MLSENITINHITALPYGGAFIAAQRLNEALIQAGERSVIATEGHNTFYSNFCRKIDFELGKINGNKTSISYLRKSNFANLVKHKPSEQVTTLTNLHWIPGRISHEIKRTLQQKNVFWTMHDLHAATGLCHYPGTCDNFTSSCTNCPQISKFFTPAISLRHRQRVNTVRSWKHLSIIAPSKWIASQLQASTVFKHSRICWIPNAVPTEIFRPINPATHKSKTITIGILGTNYAQSKNSSAASNILEKLYENHGHSIQHVTIGRSSLTLQRFEKFATPEGIGAEEMAAALRECDLFIYTSLNDNLPNLLLELQSSGVPVFALNHGGVGETFAPGDSGVLAESESELFFEIDNILAHPIELNRMSVNARTFALKNFSYSEVASRYLDFYSDGSE